MYFNELSNIGLTSLEEMVIVLPLLVDEGRTVDVSKINLINFALVAVFVDLDRNAVVSNAFAPFPCAAFGTATVEFGAVLLVDVVCLAIPVLALEIILAIPCLSSNFVFIAAFCASDRAVVIVLAFSRDVVFISVIADIASLDIVFPVINTAFVCSSSDSITIALAVVAFVTFTFLNAGVSVVCSIVREIVDGVVVFVAVVIVLEAVVSIVISLLAVVVAVGVVVELGIVVVSLGDKVAALTTVDTTIVVVCDGPAIVIEFVMLFVVFIVSILVADGVAVIPSTVLVVANDTIPGIIAIAVLFIIGAVTIVVIVVVIVVMIESDVIDIAGLVTPVVTDVTSDPVVVLPAAFVGLLVVADVAEIVTVVEVVADVRITVVVVMASVVIVAVMIDGIVEEIVVNDAALVVAG